MEKINVAELLKDCPRGMELDCTMYDNLYFDSLNADYYGTINCYTLIDGIKTSINFTEYGTFNNHIGAKCVIFPKGKTTWEGFKRPFKDGDIVATSNGLWIGITTGGEINSFIPTYCVIRHHGEFEAYLDKKETWQFNRLANEEEKQKLFDAIKANGYKWNEETKTLEKLVEPKFKVGDKIKRKGDTRLISIKDVRDGYYIITIPDFFDNCYITDKLSFNHQDDYELIPNKFDITNLKPFDKVLVRHNKDNKWCGSFFSHIDGNFHSNCYKYVTIAGKSYPMCIPYEKNEHLLGTTNDCDEYFKNWE